jgi:predicted ATPase
MLDSLSMGFHLHIENFRCLREVDLDLEGVCVLIGPNGSGKSTLLRALRFMSTALWDSAVTAVEQAGGGGTLRNWSSAGDILLRASVGDLAWEVLPKPQGAGVQLPMEERFVAGREIVVEQLPNSSSFTISGKPFPLEPQGLRGRNQPDWGALEDGAPFAGDALLLRARNAELAAVKRFERLVMPLVAYSYAFEPELRHIRASGSQLSTDTETSDDGKNIFSVLRNWKAGERRHEERFVFVREGLRRSFPDLFDDMDFVVAGQVANGRFYVPGSRRPIDFHLAPTGLLTALLHLATVASNPAGIIAIDEFENSLHPHAIRVLIEHIRERAAKLDLTVLLASHSPVVLDQFRDFPHQAIVMDSAGKPTPLDQLESKEWLAQFSLGDLYANENIGAVKTAS